MTTWSHALVTGGAGFIGSHLTRALLADGRRVTVLDNLSVGRREAVPDGARFVHGDVRDEAAVNDALSGVDCVFHLAAQVTIRGSFDRFHEDLETNVMGTARLLRAVDRTRVKWFTLASSMAVYADAESPAPIDESHPTRPLSPYGVGKLAAEDVSRQVLEARGIPFTAVRYFNTYGPGQTYTPYVGVLTIFITRLLRGESITIFGDGEQQRDFIHVERHRLGDEGDAGARARAIQPRHRAGHVAQPARDDGARQARARAAAAVRGRAGRRAAFLGGQHRSGAEGIGFHPASRVVR